MFLSARYYVTILCASCYQLCFYKLFVQTCIIYGTCSDVFDFLCVVTLTLTLTSDLQGNNE